MKSGKGSFLKLPKSRLSRRRLEALFKESAITERYFFPPAPPAPPQFAAEEREGASFKDKGQSHESPVEKN